MIKVKDETWALYIEKYKGLMHRISNMVNVGDVTISNPEDNFQDLHIEALNSFDGFYRKLEKEGNKQEPEEFVNSKGFDKYTKSCLWHYKNRKAKHCLKKAEIRKALSIHSYDDDHLERDIEIPISGRESTIEFDIDSYRMQPETKKILKLALQDPKLITYGGGPDLTKISKKANIPLVKVEHHLKVIRERLELELES